MSSITKLLSENIIMSPPNNNNNNTTVFCGSVFPSFEVASINDDDSTKHEEEGSNKKQASKIELSRAKNSADRKRIQDITTFL